MKIKIIFDIEILANAYKINETGIFRVANELLKRLKKHKDVEVIYSFQNVDNHRATEGKVLRYFADHNEIPVYAARSKRVKFLPFRKEKPFRLLYEKLGISNFKVIFNSDETNAAQIYHSVYYPIPKNLIKYPHLKKIVTVHDLIPILFPKLNDNTDILEAVVESIGTDNYAICVSENTKQDLLKYAPKINPDHVFVASLGASPEIFHPVNATEALTDIKEKYHLPEHYFLSLSTLEPRKNIAHLIRCFLKFIVEHQIYDISLVLVGAKGWQFDDIFAEQKNAEHLKDKIIFTGRIPDEDLAYIYSGANSFYYLSLYEGFGLPPLEAMQCGVPTVTSNNSSLPEVVGNGGIMLNPKDEKALCEVMHQFYRDENFRAEYAEKALQRSKSFSWAKTVEMHMEIYKKIIQN